ncbi:MAG: hypothetical protein AAF492_32260, partial [Verrucomicrobiota bacterium]
MKDTDGDDKADLREVIFSGFGTGDTHQNINSFTWSPGGELFFCQGLHAFSRVETPWGIVRMDEHGVFRLRPRRRQLHAFRGVSGQNPWGVAFGHWGEPFAKGNNNELSEFLPVMVHTENRHRTLNIGHTKSKSMVAEIVDSVHLPDDIQGNVLIAGYFAHMIDRLRLMPDGAGHKAEALAPLLVSGHRSFRPVDIKVGPDGAVYIADWFNPIIGHYQASLRHPDRNREHGRIWRITAKGRPLVETPRLDGLSVRELFEQLKSPHRWVRHQARLLLSARDTEEIEKAVRTLSPNDDRQLFDILSVLEWHESVDRRL